MTGVWAVLAHRAVTVAVVAVALGCADDSAGSPKVEPPTIVAVETQRCRQPNRFHGVGTVVGDDLVLTAGHTVEGDLRDLTVDGAPARIVTIDRRTDLAVLSVDVPASAPPTPAPHMPEMARVMDADETRDVTIDRRVTLIVEHATDRATYRRQVVFFAPGVSDGDSGTPLVDEGQRLVGVVIADQAGEGVAVTVHEITDLLASVDVSDDLTWPDPPGAC